MCGIFCALGSSEFIVPDKGTTDLLSHRGPDSFKIVTTVLDPLYREGEHFPCNGTFVEFVSTVLALRGQTVVRQPLVSENNGSILCWNGEVWSFDDEPIQGNDSQFVFEKLLAACAPTVQNSEEAVIQVLSSIRGPYAFVFLDAPRNRFYYGRDCLGRRSLLRKTNTGDFLVLSSVCDNASGDSWSEVEADGIYISRYLRVDPTHFAISHRLVGHVHAGTDSGDELSFRLPFPCMNRTIPDSLSISFPDVIEKLHVSLRNSLKLRTQHVREAVNCSASNDGNKSNVAILFSGGLDCTILARLCHELLPLDHAIDLLNVAFENPRVHSKLEAGQSPYEQCPDRMTGRSSHAELIKVCPGRVWRFVQIDVPYTDTQAHRDVVTRLMHPHNTEMDLSISYALYFASRGVGFTRATTGESVSYTSTAPVLLSGLGADELFGGYQRHATAFARRGYTGLIEELELDFDRLGKRNLGRDDRVISDSGKEARFPFLDEDFISVVLELPVNAKCDFGTPQVESSQVPVEFLEPAKRALRLLAWELGMHKVANEKKRAIQFGARTAKMETGKTKGTHVLS